MLYIDKQAREGAWAFIRHSKFFNNFFLNYENVEILIFQIILKTRCIATIRQFFFSLMLSRAQKRRSKLNIFIRFLWSGFKMSIIQKHKFTIILVERSSNRFQFFKRMHSSVIFEYNGVSRVFSKRSFG